MYIQYIYTYNLHQELNFFIFINEIALPNSDSLSSALIVLETLGDPLANIGALPWMFQFQ
jgi:hypothetical protein